MFNQEVQNALIESGLKDNEAEVYLCLLQNSGGLHVQEITDKTSIKRSTVNLILERLIQKGFVSYHIEETWKVYMAESPSKILHSLQETTENFKNILPLLSTSNFGGKKAKIKFFEGPDTVSKIHKDIILSTKYLKEPKELLAFSSGKDIYEADSESVEWFVKNRVKNSLNLRWIAPEDEFTHKRFISTAKDELREVKFFDPKKYPFNIQINIYANSIALISLKGNKSGAIIDNPLIADSFRALFNLLWDSLR